MQLSSPILQPVRKAVLIGAPGYGKDRLHGVENDLANFREFLMSPRGGVWRPSEITVLEDPTDFEVIASIHSTYSDYQFVYYSGHGCQDRSGIDCICLNGNNLQDGNLFNDRCPRQFLLLDSCRKYYHTISGFPKELEKWEYADGYSAARKIFDNYILNSPPGKMKMYAAAAGEVAMDNRYGLGGEFTLALLKGIYSSKVNKGFEVIFPEKALMLAKQNLIKEGEKQIPVIVNVEGNLLVPLALVSSEFIRKETVDREHQQIHIRQQFERSGQRRSNQAAAGLIIAGLVIWGLSK